MVKGDSMPTYDYLCEANGRIMEVKHSMSDAIKTWGELCERTGIACGDTSPEAPVSKLATGGQVVKSSNLGSGNTPACSSGGCCGGGMCGLN
jgi:hypothetical protein